MKKRYLAVMLCSLSLTLGACGQSSEKYAASAVDTGVSMDASYDEAEEADMVENDESAEGEEAGTVIDAKYSQKLIRTYDYSLETLDFEASMDYISRQVAKYRGYVEESDTYGKSERTSYMKIRIPQEKADAFLTDAESIGEVIQKSEATEDITLDYYDTKSRLDSLKAQHTRLLELLEKADSLEDVVSLEKHLSDVEYQIDSYGSKLKVYDNQVDYVTISIHLEEVSQLQAGEEDGFWEKIRRGFSNNLEHVLEGTVSFVILLITAIPYLVAAGIVGGLVYALVRAIRKKRTKRQEKKEKQMES